MSDPFAPSTDPDIPTPTREDLLRLVHGENRDQLEAGSLPAKVAETLWADARRQWDEGHKAQLADANSDIQQQQKDSTPEPKEPTGVRVHAPRRATPEQVYSAKLRAFMSPQARAAYDAADDEQKQIIWAANERAFEDAEIRKAQRLRDEQKLMEKIFDRIQRIKEDPNKAHLLPPTNASISELRDWYKEISKSPGSIDAGAGTQSSNRPDYGNPSESQLRQDRIWHALHRTGRADPEDIAEEEAEEERYERKLAEARERRLKEVEAEFAKPDLRQLQEEVDRSGKVMGEAAEILRRNAAERKSEKPIVADTHAEQKLAKVPSTTKTIWTFIRKFAAVAGVFLLGASWSMLQIDEFGFALFLLVVGIGAFSIQIYDWKGIEGHFKATKFLKSIAAVLILFSLVFFSAVIVKRRQTKPWSILLEQGKASPVDPQRNEVQTEVLTPTPTGPRLIPTIYEVRSDEYKSRSSDYKRNVAIWIVLGIHNSGAPVTVGNFRLDVQIPERSEPVVVIKMHWQESFTFTDIDGKVWELERSNMIEEKVTESPIQTGAEPRGLLLFSLPNVKYEELKAGTILKISFVVYGGTLVTCSYPLTEGIDNVPFQYIPGIKARPKKQR